VLRFIIKRCKNVIVFTLVCLLGKILFNGLIFLMRVFLDSINPLRVTLDAKDSSRFFTSSRVFIAFSHFKNINGVIFLTSDISGLSGVNVPFLFRRDNHH